MILALRRGRLPRVLIWRRILLAMKIGRRIDLRIGRIGWLLLRLLPDHDTLPFRIVGPL